MLKSRRSVGLFSSLFASLLCVILVAAACADDEDGAEPTATTEAETTAPTEAPDEPDEAPTADMTHLGDGSLGTVTVEAGDAVQIRSLNAISGDVAFFGLPIERSVVLAIRDYGTIKGFDVDLGTTLDDLCSNDGGQAAAQTIVADDRVVGVIGTSCSGAAVAAAPLIGAAGMTMISGGNTSPALTSDLAGNAGANYSEGYYRTAHNDLFQGAAMAHRRGHPRRRPLHPGPGPGLRRRLRRTRRRCDRLLGGQQGRHRHGAGADRGRRRQSGCTVLPDLPAGRRLHRRPGARGSGTRDHGAAGRRRPAEHQLPVAAADGRHVLLR
ncbi:MAG: ABC transporter substrate-binding protein, partial [Acidimicrobiia bacterium]|nr:ABC transporter substrate-binding protein [Acidimicrobiia bacterium]